MQVVNVTGYDEHIDSLEVHPDEFETLFNTTGQNSSARSNDRNAGAAAWFRSIDSGALPRQEARLPSQ